MLVETKRRGRLFRRALSCALVVWAGAAHAEEPPVFPGPPELTRYTKEVGLETTASLLDAGGAVGFGATVSSFYAPWLASLAGATYSPRGFADRERWEARAGARLVRPTPIFGSVFGYLVLGGGLLFTEAEEAEGTYRRALTGIVGLGAFTNIGDRVRLRLELRQHFRLLGEADTRTASTAGFAFVLLSR